MSLLRKRIIGLLLLLPTLTVVCGVYVLVSSGEDKYELRNSSKNEKEAVLMPRKRVSNSVQSEARGRPSQMVNITLYEQGIYPQKIRARPGRIIFSIDDRTGQASGLTISTGGRQERLERTGGTIRGKGVIELGVGQYEIADASRPENRAILIVQP